MGPQNSRGLDSQMPWRDLNMDEKIERIHQVVRNIVQKVGTLEQQVNKTTQNVQDHSHDDHGAAIVKTKLGSNREYLQEIPISPYPPGMIANNPSSVPQLDNGEDTYF